MPGASRRDARPSFRRMKHIAILVALATSLAAQDVYVPPVPIGIKGEGKIRTAKRPIVFPDERVPWIRVRTSHYDIVSSASEERTRDIAGDLETLAAILTRTSDRFRSGVVPTTVLVFADRSESQPYFDLLLARENARATGVYVRHSGGGTMIVDAARRQRIERTAMHELVHDLLRQGDEIAPHWIEEGLAEYFANAEMRDGRVMSGSPIRAHVSMLRRRLPIPLEELFAVEAETDLAMTPAFYAESWAAVDWLMRMGREKFFAFLRDLESGASVPDALHEHYAKTLRDMAAEIHGGGRARQIVEWQGGPAVQPAAFTVTPVDRASLLFELGRFLSHVAGSEEDSQRHYREALRIDPHHARSLAATGRFEEAIAAGLEDADVHLWYAETLLTTALGPFAGVFEPQPGDAERFRKARALAERALALGSDEGATRAAIGATYLVEIDPHPGIPHLERALALLPRRNDVALNLYALLLRTGQRAKADALFREVFANPRDKQVAFAAKNVLLVAETTRANALAKAGKLDEAAKIVRDLAAATGDSVGRRDLEQQAARLESTAAVNRHIRLYNEAVALANTGKNRDAVKVLDRLLLVATDPVVVRDATKFREELRKR